jgi:hypothetical protein
MRSPAALDAPAVPSGGRGSPRSRLEAAIRRADRTLYQTIHSSARLLREERAAKANLPLRVRMAMWRHGFLSDSVVLYDLEHNDPREYISDYHLYARCTRINTWNGLYDHKLGLRAFLLAMGFRQAETVAYLYEGRAILDPFGAGMKPVDIGRLADRLRADAGERGYVVKPENGLGGTGVFLLTERDGRLYRQRGQSTEPFDLEWLARDTPTVIERRLTQHAFWRTLYPDSTNTMRLLTLWTPGEAAPFIAGAAQRVGTADTVPTDDFAGGGISCPIDRGTGRLGAGRMHPVKDRRPGRRFTSHPESGARLEGAVLPGWDRVTDAVLRAAASLPFNRMGGWDVMVDQDGEPVILEANGNGGRVDVMQIHGGLLADPRVRRFYETEGIL